VGTSRGHEEWGWSRDLMPQGPCAISPKIARRPTVDLTRAACRTTHQARLRASSNSAQSRRRIATPARQHLNDRANIHFMRLAEHLKTTRMPRMVGLFLRRTESTLTGGGIYPRQSAALFACQAAMVADFLGRARPGDPLKPTARRILAIHGPTRRRTAWCR